MRAKNGTLRFLQLTILACLLSACDGGLFGTGDGQTIVVDTATSDSGLGGDVTNASAGENDSDAITESFDNLQIGTTTTTPLINLINVSDRTIAAILDTSNSLLFAAPIASGGSTQTAQLPLGENNIILIDPDTSNELLAVRPLNVGGSTLTTLLVRGNATQVLDVVLLSSMSISLTPSLAQLRVVQANLLSNEDTAATFTLQPSGSSPGGSEVSFPDISRASASSASYQSVSPGDYSLVDSLSRIDAEPVNMQAGNIYTLIILNNPTSAILLHEDDLLAR
ncbi:MAG: hypothetical protein ACI8VW_000296 [bacterium]|jgi:hypothetical protein